MSQFATRIDADIVRPKFINVHWWIYRIEKQMRQIRNDKTITAQERFRRLSHLSIIRDEFNTIKDSL